MGLVIFCLLLKTIQADNSSQEIKAAAERIELNQATINEDGIRMTVSDDESEYVCSSKVVLQLFGDTEKLTAANPINSKAIKRLCPKLEKSCCTREQLSLSFKQYKAGVKDMQRVKRLHEFVFTNFSMNTQFSIKTLFNSYKTQNIKQCMGEENFRRVDSDLDYIFEHLEQSNIYFLFSFNFVLRFYSGVACELCNADSHAFIEPRSELHPVAKILIANKNISEIILINQLFAKYLRFVIRFVNLLKMAECKQGVDNIKFLDEIAPLIQKFIAKSEIFELCRLKYKELRFFESNDSCNQIFKLFESLLDSRVLFEVAEIYRRVYLSLTNSFQIKYYNDKGLEGVESSIRPTFFAESNEHELFYLGSVDYEIVEKGGFDVFENRFAASLIRESAAMTATKLLTSLIALIIFLC